MNYKAGATHKLKPSPVGPDIPKLEQPQNPIFNTSLNYSINSDGIKGNDELKKLFPIAYMKL